MRDRDCNLKVVSLAISLNYIQGKYQKAGIFMEIWKDIEGYENLYQVSNLGNVRSLERIVEAKRKGNVYTLIKKGHLLVPTKRNHNYLGVYLYNKDGAKVMSVHRLVANAFIPNPNNYSEVNHINENKQDNRVSNLEWCSHKQNMNCGTVQQRRSQTRYKRKIGWKAIEQYTMDGKFVKRFESLAQINKELGYGQGNILKCIQGKINYQHAYHFIWKYAKQND